MTIFINNLKANHNKKEHFKEQAENVQYGNYDKISYDGQDHHPKF